MKKLIFLMAIALISITDSFAEPIKWHASGTVEIGRPKKGCKGLWLCIKVEDWGVSFLTTYSGNPDRNEHGIGVGVDGNLYMIINENLLIRNQSDKLNLLRGQSQYTLDEDELLPQHLLSTLKYTGSNTIKAGIKKVSYESGFYFIKLN